MQPRIIQDTRQKNKKDDRYPLKVRLIESGQAKYFPLKIYVSVSQFDSEGEKVKKHPQAILYNTRIAQAINSISKLILVHPGFTAAEIFDAYKSELNQGSEPKKKTVDLIEYFEGFIERCKEGKIDRTEGTIVTYESTLNHLKAFKSAGNKVSFDAISLSFYEDFTQYLRSSVKGGMKDNTIGKNIKNLKMILNRAFDEGVSKTQEHKRSSFKTLKEDVDNIYLNEAEIEKIYKTQLTGVLERERDRLVLGCWLGLRFSDNIRIRKENIVESNGKKLLKIKTVKTGQAVVIPLKKTALEILEKYNYETPPPVSNQKTNEYLKEIGRLAGINDKVVVTEKRGGKISSKVFKKWELITTHTARRSFATNAYLAKIPAISIMKITGHRDEKSFLKYIKINQEENALAMAEHKFFN